MEWREITQGKPSKYVVTTERSPKTNAHAVVLMFGKWYRALGLQG